MVFVCVGEHQAEEILALFDQETDVRQDEIDARQVFACKCDAEIDRDPLPAPSFAEPVNREIHADLARASQRCEDKLVASAGHQVSPLGGWCGVLPGAIE